MTRPRLAAAERNLLIAFGLLFVVWLLMWRAERPHETDSATEPYAAFSGARARELLHTLLGDGAAHPIGSQANAQLRDRILAQLHSSGYAPQLQSGQWACGPFGTCAAPVNILARLDAANAAPSLAPDAVLLAAHYDSVPAGPGASDDGASVASVLEIARLLKQRPAPRRSIIFLIDDGEEPGLIGASAFVQAHPWAKSVAAVVNLDARGTHGPSVMFETGSANRELMQIYAQAVNRPHANSVYYTAYQHMPNSTDFTVFARAGYQGFNFAYIDGVSHYHTPRDDWPSASAASMGEQGADALACVWALANAPSISVASTQAVYFDLFSRWLLHAPAAAMLPAAGLCLLALVGIAGWLVWKRRLSWGALLWGLVGCVLALLAASLIAPGSLLPLSWLHLQPRGGALVSVAHPAALQAAFVCLAVLVLMALARALQPRGGWLALAQASALLSGLIALWLAGKYPGLCYLVLAGAVAGILGAWSLNGLLLVSAVGFLVIAPVLLPLYSALGGSALPLLTLLLVLAGLPLAALAAASVRARIWISRLALWGLVVSAVLAFALPRYSVQAPARLDISYELNADTHAARWIVESPSGPLPRAMARIGAFQRHGTDYTLPGSPFSLDAPVLSVVSARRLDSDGSRALASYTVHIASARAAPLLIVNFSPAAAVQDVVLIPTSGQSLPVQPRRLADGSSSLWLWTAPPQGMELHFTAAADAAPLTLEDYSYGLPPDGRALQQARSAQMVPWQLGDVSVVKRDYVPRLP